MSIITNVPSTAVAVYQPMQGRKTKFTAAVLEQIKQWVVEGIGRYEIANRAWLFGRVFTSDLFCQRESVYAATIAGQNRLYRKGRYVCHITTLIILSCQHC